MRWRVTRNRQAVHALALAALFCSCARPSSDGADVAIRIVDASTGKTTPAMVAIVSLEDDSLRLPPDGRRYEGGGSVIADFHRGIEFDPDPNWIGPVRKMPLAVASTKHLLNYGRDHSVADTLDYQQLWMGAVSQGKEMGTYFKAKADGEKPTYEDLPPLE